jgi:hypothetical protein
MRPRHRVANEGAVSEIPKEPRVQRLKAVPFVRRRKRPRISIEEAGR